MKKSFNLNSGGMAPDSVHNGVQPYVALRLFVDMPAVHFFPTATMVVFHAPCNYAVHLFKYGVVTTGDVCLNIVLPSRNLDCVTVCVAFGRINESYELIGCKAIVFNLALLLCI